ncbi:MAG: integral rane protein-like protein [Chloroflexi bacterium]|nr:integral rane protein-like protein [Chloroflexota bacterium]
MSIVQANDARVAAPTRLPSDGLQLRAVLLTWLPLAPAIALLVIGYLRLRVLGPFAPQQLFGTAATGNVAWSDIISIYGRDTMAGHPFPYSPGHSFEYPVLSGLLMWVTGFAGYARDATPAFTVNYVILALSAIVLLALIIREPGSNPWLFALSPALVLYTGLNWDMVAILPGVAALLLYRRGQDLPATILLTVSVWLKFFAIIWLPIVLIERARRGEWRDCVRIVAVFAALSVVINLPFAIYNRAGWGLFFTFNRERPAEVNFWTLFRRFDPSVALINNLTLLGVVAVIVVLGVLQCRRAGDMTIPASFAVLTWFFFLNKVYSPQYFIWLVPFMALMAIPLWLYVLLTLADVVFYVASFQLLHLEFVLTTMHNLALRDWDFDHVLMPAMVFREAAFLVLTGWIVLWLARRPQDSTVRIREAA